MGEAVRVGVVAQSEVARAGLARLLERAEHVRQVSLFEPGEFAAEAREDNFQLLILSCDVLLLWCAAVPGPAEEWAAELAAVAGRNGIRVVLLLPNAQTRHAVNAGCPPHDGILGHDTLTTRGLDEALRRIADGERVLPEPPAPSSGETSRTRAQGSGTPAGELRTPLTERERRILELLAEGLPNRRIGQVLGLSEHAAKRAVAITLSKLGCLNRTQAVVVALREGLVGDRAATHP
jgi:DNA-binding NarL/FixJ family response regulator